MLVFLYRSVRRSFDRIAGKSEFGLTLSQCQNALTWLGYPSSLTTMETLKQIMQVLKDIQQFEEINVDKAYINFDEYCILTSYLSILQQEISESSCVSPIKGTNLQPPPIFLSNSPGKKKEDTILVKNSQYCRIYDL